MSGWAEAASTYRLAKSVAVGAAAAESQALSRALVEARAAGLSIRETAAGLGLSKSSIARHWNTGPQPRIVFRDVKPYLAPERWEQLEGPDGGVVELPHDVLWLPDRRVDLGTESGRELAYTALLEEGTPAQQARLLNPQLLIEAWAGLPLPARVRSLWEERFPQLCGAA